MRRAYTLLELSMVLLILGSIVTGVFVGRELVKQARLNNVVSEMGAIKTATIMFQTKYNFLPGDIINATSLFSTCSDSGANTCNGNGNGVISGFEDLRAMQHLSLDKLLAGNYSGIQISPTVRFNGGTNTLTSKGYPGSGYHLFSAVEGASYYKTIGVLSELAYTDTGGLLVKPIISPKDAYYLDRKFDDGLAYSGEIYARHETGAANTLCVDGGTSASSVNYVLTDLTNSCLVLMWVKHGAGI